MKRTLPQLRGAGGFTLVETMIGVAVTAMMFAAVVVGAMFLQKSLSSTQYDALVQNNEMRVMDAVTRDVRSALAVTPINGGTGLRLELPQDYDADGNAVDPRIVGNDVVYGSDNARTVVSYYQEGANFVREVAGRKTLLASNLEDFEPTFQVNGGEVATAVAPKSNAGRGKALGRARKPMQMKNNTALRNKQRAPVAAATPPAGGGGTPPPPKKKK